MFHIKMGSDARTGNWTAADAARQAIGGTQNTRISGAAREQFSTMRPALEEKSLFRRDLSAGFPLD
jgi:hypothetical protein